MGKGTGIVTSVPSDAPDDYITFQELKTKQNLREYYNLKVILIFKKKNFSTTYLF